MELTPGLGGTMNVMNIPLPETLANRESELMQMTRWTLVQECLRLVETGVLTAEESKMTILWHSWMWDELAAPLETPEDFDDIPF